MTRLGKSELVKAIERLDELEPELRSLDTLFALGEVITRSEGGFQAGDFDVNIWGHGLEGFSAGAIVRARMDGEPFPMLSQEQTKWVLCCKGKFKIAHDEAETMLEVGQCLLLSPRITHTIYPAAKECVAVMVTVPADPGMK